MQSPYEVGRCPGCMRTLSDRFCYCGPPKSDGSMHCATLNATVWAFVPEEYEVKGTSKQYCVECKKTESPMWWKCCPKHVSERGPDVICHECMQKLHPEGPENIKPVSTDG